MLKMDSLENIGKSCWKSLLVKIIGIVSYMKFKNQKSLKTLLF